MHNHICPAFLEKFEPAKEDEDYELLIAGGGVLRGQCSLDWFTDCYEDCRKLANKMSSEKASGQQVEEKAQQTDRPQRAV